MLVLVQALALAGVLMHMAGAADGNCRRVASAFYLHLFLSAADDFGPVQPRTISTRILG